MLARRATGKLCKACNWLAACKREGSEQLEVMPKVSEPHEIALYLPQVPIRGNLFSLLVHSWIFSDSCCDVIGAVVTVVRVTGQMLEETPCGRNKIEVTEVASVADPGVIRPWPPSSLAIDFSPLQQRKNVRYWETFKSFPPLARMSGSTT